MDVKTKDRNATEIISDVQAEFTRILAEEVQKFDPREMARQVLTQNTESIIKQSLGFSKRWGDWEVDHCNGREPAASQALKARANQTVHEWLLEQAGKLPELNAQQVKALHKEYFDYLHKSLRSALQERAQQQARQIASALTFGGKEE